VTGGPNPYLEQRLEMLEVLVVCAVERLGAVVGDRDLAQYRGRGYG